MNPRKLTKEDIDKVRGIEGFPIGTDEDIIALSDAPYYTACPNPFIEEFIRENGTPYNEETDDYHCEPFAADVSEQKNDAIYNAHSYHTKVPYKAIVNYLLHYTKPGDIVLDGFCGTGMAGVAALQCGTASTQFKYAFSHIKNAQWGYRNAILCDLSPEATFISYNYNHQFDISAFEQEATGILQKIRKECGWMYETNHAHSSGQASFLGERAKGEINYTVWSDALVCPRCGKEFVFWDVAVDEEHGKVADKFKCPSCRAELSKRDCEHSVESYYDEKVGKILSCSKQVPVQITYTYNGRRYDKKPDTDDMERIKKISELSIPYWYPTNEFEMGDKTVEPIRLGVTRVNQMFTKANLYVLSMLANEAQSAATYCLIGDIVPRGSKMHKIAVSRLNTNLSKTAGILSGTLFLPSNSIEYSAIYMIGSRIADVLNFMRQSKHDHHNIISCQSTTDLSNIPANSVDYIFTDPPFGENLMYSELNYVSESWLKVFTNNKQEAIINKTQKKSLTDYQELMTQCLVSYYRVLKPGRWITVEFHNSKNAVWNSIQEALGRAGFIIADVRTLDKKQGSFNQVKGASQAIKQDLVISAYKPKDHFTKEFYSQTGTSETAWAFVRQHLENIPVVVLKNDKIEIIAERQAYLLFDRMVAYHIMQGIPVPLDASDFYKGLDEKFLRRDGMYFLPDQVNEYDTARIVSDVEPIQFSLFVTNEKTAVSWLYQQLSEEVCGPQTYAEIQPKFMQEVKSVDRYEDMPELAVLLEENFLQDDQGRWYIPDVTKEGDLAKLREKKLWKEFEGYLNSKGKLKLFRSEAIRVGFSRLWKDKNYQAIVDIAERLPEQTIQEDPNLLMYYDISLSRVER